MRNKDIQRKNAVFRQFGGTNRFGSARNGFAAPATVSHASGFMRVAVVLLLAAGIFVGGSYAFVVFQGKKADSTNVQSLANYNVQNIPLKGLVDSGSLGLDTSQSLSINGQLRVNNSLVIAPSSKPSNGTIGQVYYDKDGQYLAYYNGSKFVNIAGTDAVDALQAKLNALQTSVSQLPTTAVSLPSDMVTESRNNNFTGSNSFGSGLSATSISSGSLDTTSLTTSGATLLQGSLDVTGTTNLGSANISSLVLSSALSVGSGGTGTSSLANNGVVIGQGSSALATVSTGTAGLCLMSTAGAPSFQACPGGVGAGVTSFNGLTGALSLNNATGAGATITIDDASTTGKGIASFNASNFSVSGGSVNTIQNIGVSSTPTFAGLTLSAPLAIGSGGTGTNSLTSNGVVIGQGSAALSTVTAPGAGFCLVSTAGAPTFQACPGSGGVSSVDGLTGALNISDTTGAGSTVTINTATTAAKGIASFNATNFSVTAGAVNTVQNIGTTASPLFNALTLSTALSVSSGGTGAASFTANGLLVGQGSSAFTTVTAAGAGLCLVSTAGAPSFQACPGSGGVTSLNGLSGVLNLNNASGSGSSVTIDDASTTSKGIASFNSSNFSVTSGAVNTIQNISTTSSPTFNALTLTTALGVANGGTGAASLASNGVLIGQGTSAVSSVTAGGAGQCLVSTAGAPTFQACPGSGGVSSLNGLNGALVLNNSSGAGSSITIDNATTTTKGIASFDGTNFTVTAGAVNTVQNINSTATPTFGGLTLNGSLNGQTISSAANFTGSLTVGTTLFANTITPSGAMTIGATGQILTLQGNASTSLSATSGGNTSTLAFQSPTANVTYRLQTAAAGTYDVCTTAGNCTGVGGGVTTSGGTAGKIAKFTGSQAIADSLLSESGSTVTVGGSLSVNTITPTAAMTVGATTQSLILQGDSSTKVSATSGGITNSLLFALPAGSNKSITLPNASGTVAVSASGPIALDANGNISCPTCTTTGGGAGGAVDSLNGLNGTLTIANASGAGSTITIDNATTAAKGIASFNSTNFTVTAGAVNTIQDISVTSSPTFNALTLSTALSVANGGTGATTAAGARTNLGAAASGANSDITSLSGLTTALSIAQGGTGATTSQAAINNVSQLTTAGDLLYYDGTNSTRLARGTNGQCLTSNTTTVVWGSCGLSAEADTLATVTARGSSTTTAVQLQGGAAVRGLTVDTATATDDQIVMAIATGGAARFDGTITAADLTANRTYTLPNASGTFAVSASGPIVLDANGNISCPTCGVSGAGVNSVNTLTGSLTISNSTGAGTTITIDDASTTAKGIASFNSANFTVTAGAVNTVQNISTTSSPTFNALTLSTALSVANGGTGATTASGARTNLGAAASGANSDITSLSGLTTALSIAQGGTGATTSQSALNNISQLTTAGDLLYYDGTNSTRLARGTSGQCLTSNTTTVVWGSCGLSAEADTLATVTARGSNTSTAVQLQGGASIRGLTVDTATATDDQLILAIATGGAARFDGTITAADLTANRTWTLPNASGTIAVSASGPIVLDANGNVSCPTCGVAGSGVTSLNGLTGALTVSNASAAGSTITINDATTAAKGIASFNSTNFSVTAGAVNTIQDIATTSSPTFNALTLTTALSIANGGTGATTASGARTNLGAAASGANSDITSLSGLTTALSLAQGGTGATTSQAAINNVSQLTTAGDLLYYDGTNSTRLARGTNGQCLTSNTTTVVWGSCGLSAESDTLATVTARGSSTTTAVQLQGGAAVRGLTVDTATATDDQIVLAIATGGAARFDGTITAADLTANRTYTLPNASGTFAVSASGPIVLDANGNISCPTCGVSGSGVTSLNGLTGALTVSNASAAGSTITINDATTAAKGIASFNSTNFTVTAGAVNTIQDIATTSSPTFNALTLSTALSVANGGTGSTTASGARTNLGAAASGANSDITSLSGLTTALSIAQGGTGGTTSQAAINNVSQLTTAGDLLYYDGTNSTRLARGTNGQCLTSNATTVVWGACGAGEVDTLATVTARGSSTTTAVQLQGGASIRGLTVDTATATDDQIILAIATGGAARFDGTITAADLTANRTWTLPNASGTFAVSATGPIVLDASGNISCPTCTTGGGGAGGAVDSLNGLNGTLTIANASGSGSTITINDATTAAKGIASFNSTNFTVTAGAVNTVQDIATTSSPTFNALTLTTALSVANGGTGATTAAGARTNLGAAASGANSDITSLSGLTTALSIGQGGTGATTSQGAINNISQLTTNGDLLYNNGTNSTRLARGTNGQCLNSNATTILWGSCGLTSEADTLATVTARGATTSTAVLLQGGATVRGVTVDTATATDDQLAFSVTVGGAARFTGTVTSADLTAARTYTLPDASGTLAVSASGNIALSSVGNITFTGVLPVANGGTGANTLTANGVILGNGTSALTAVAAGGAGQCLVSTAGAPVFQACPGSGGVASVNSLTGALTINNATGAGSAITIDNASTTAKGIASFNSTNFTVTAGAVNTIQDIATTSSPTFNALSLTTALSVANGGTGATTASGARTNLGAAASGANSDITSLSGLTTALSIGQGGTGATTSQGALNNISQLTTNGDLLYFNGTNSTRLARGTNGQCLTSDATTVLWGSCGLTAEADTLATVTARGATTSTAVALQGGATIRGATIDTATATDDKITLAVTAGGAASFTGTVTSADLTAARTWTLPNETGTFCMQGSTNCGFATSTGSGNYIQNTLSQQPSSNFWISGTGRADTTLQSPALDSTGATLTLGGTNATSISVVDDVSMAAGKSITFVAGAGNFDQSASTGTFKTGTGAVSLNGDTTIASGKAFLVQGAATFQNSVDSTSALNVKNAGGTSALVVDTTNRRVGVNNANPNATLDVMASSADFTNGFETGVLSPLTVSGAAGWAPAQTNVHTGAYSARVSANSGGTSTLTLTRTLNSAGTVSFWINVIMGATGCTNTIAFQIDGVSQQTWGCNTTYPYTLRSFSVASGTHTFTWVVGAHTNNANYVAVDDITVTNSGSGTAALFNGGNVGIGTSFPNATLDVAGTTLFHPTTDGANAFQLQNSTGLNVLVANTSTGAITLGNVTSTVGAGLAGSLIFADGTNDNFGATLNTTTLTANRTITIPNASGTLAVSASGNINLSATGDITFTGVLPVVNGGTGAATASGARTNLGAAASGANSDITSLSGLTTALSIAQGGTGATTSQGALNNISQLTTNGDLLYFNGTNSTRLARGTNGQCLTSDATTILWGSCGLTAEADTLATVTARGATTSTGVALQGGATIRGATIDTATATDDKIAMSVTTGGAASFTGTVTSADLTAARTWTLPDASGTFCMQGSTSCGFATSTGSGNYIQNQNAAQQASANFWISGTGRADTALQAPSFDTATAAALSIGGTNATSISVAQNTTLAAGKSLTITGGATATRPASPTEGMLYYDTTTKQLLVYANGKWQADRSSATKVVGTSAAGGTSGAIASQNADGADYVNTSTTSAQTTINSAITSLGSTGGTVYLMEGTYVIDGTITIDRNDVRIVGAGAGTIIKIKNGTNASMNVFNNSNTYAGMTFSNFTIDGNKANNSAGTQNGIVVNNGGDSSRHSLDVNNITVKNLRSESIVTGGNDYTTISNSHFLANDGGALNIGSTHMVVSSNTITSNAYGMQIAGAGASIIGNQIKTTLSSGTGIYVPASYATISNNVVDGALAYGIYVNGSNNIVSNNQVLNSSSTGVITGVSNANNTIMNNMISGNGGDGVYLNTATTNSIVDGNRIINSGGHGVHAEGTGHQITNNNITDNGGATYAIYSVGTATIGNNTYSGTGAATINVSANTVFSSQLTPTNFLQSSSSIIKASASSSLTGTGAIAGTTTITGTSTLFLSQLEIGDRVTINSETRTISAISSDTSATVSSAFTTTASAQTVTRLPATLLLRNSSGNNVLTVDDSGALSTVATINSDAGYKINGTAGASVTCSGGNFLQNMVVSGGIVTGGTCAAGGGSGVTTVGVIDGGTYSANGASISGTTIYLQTASATQVGLVNTGAQTFAGNKTIRGALGVDTATATDDKITLSVTTGGVASFAGNITAADLTAGRTYTLPDASGTFAVSASGNIALSATGNISLTGQVPIANGGTGASTAQGAINALSGLTTMGDLLYNDGTNSTRLARGTNGQCLTSNATTVAWGSCGITSEADTLATVTARGATTSTAVLLQGGATVRGLTIDTATATDDLIAVSVTTGGATRFTGTITSADLTAARTWTLPDASGTFCLQSSASCGFAPTTGGTGYIQNQNASQQATSNFWISGTGRADTALQAPALDTAAAGALTIGGTNATSISVAQNATLAAGKSLTITGGLTATRPASPTDGMLYYDTTLHQLLQYNANASNNKWQADRSSATKIVGDASTSINADAADYVVPAGGTSAEATINSAITALGSTGGTVYLMEGTYTISAAINLPTNVTLAGSGRGTVIKIKTALNVTINMLTLSSGATNVVVRDLLLDGNKANTTGTSNGISLAASATQINLDSLVIQNMDGSGFAFSTCCALTKTTVSNSLFLSNAGSGIDLADYAQQITITGSQFISNGGNGIYIHTAGGMQDYAITGNYIEANSGSGIDLMDGANEATVTGNTIKSSGTYGIRVGASSTVSDNTILSSGTYGINVGGGANVINGNNITTYGTTSDGIYLSSTRVRSMDGNSITNNRIVNASGSGYGINIDTFGSLAKNTYISGNSFSGTGANGINDGTGNSIYVNQLDANGQMINKGRAAFSVNTSSMSASLTLQGGMIASALPSPAAPTIGKVGATGAATYTYAVSAFDGIGETLISGTASASSAANPLTGANYNTITWTKIPGAVSYKIYRTAVTSGSPATTGLIGTATASGTGTTQVFNDTGLAASGSTPAANTTGGANFAGALQGTSATLTGTNSLTVGTSSSATGSIIFKNSTNAFTATLITGVATANRTVTLGDESGTICLQNSANCGFAVGTAASYIQNTLSQQASSNFWISGTGRADTALQSPALDSTGATLTLGGTNATSISVVDNVTLAAGLSLTVTGGNTASRPAGTDGMVYYDTDTKQLLVYNAGTSKWQADRSDAILVAASNSSAADKAAADYVGDGNTAAAADGDQVQINAALTAAAGKKVVLLPGTYVADATILVPNNTTLAGVGNSTVIELADIDVSDNLIENSDATTGTGVIIRDIKLDGRSDLNTAGNQTGIALTNMGDSATSRAGALVTNVTFTRFRNDAMNITTSDNTTISNNSVTGGGNGIGVYGTGSEYNTISGNKLMNLLGDMFSLYGANNTVTGNTASNTAQNSSGYYLGGSNYTFTGNVSKGNLTGLTLDGSYNTVSGNSMIGNGDGIYATGATSTGNVISNNVVQGSTSVSPSAGITIYAHSGETVTGNTVSGGAAPGIRLLGSGAPNPANNNLISGNILKDNGGSTTNDAIYVGADADNNIITGNSITDASATTNNYAINISSSTDDGNSLANNTYTSGSIRDLGTGTIYSGQVNNAGNYLLQPTGTIELMKNTNVTGNLTVSAGKSLTLVGGNTASRPASPSEGMLYYDTDTKQLLIYANGKWQADRSTATKIVAASNSSQAAKDSADYVASGTGDQTTINSALTAAAGGKVYLMEGTYTVNGAITIPNNTTLAGAGAGTLITIPNAFNAAIKVITNSDVTTGTNITVRDLMVDGNRANNTSGLENGIYLDNVGDTATARPGAIVQNVRVNNFRNVGVSLQSSDNAVVSGSTMNNNYYNIDVESSYSDSITGNSTNLGVWGVYVYGGGDHAITGNSTYGATNSGIRIDSTTRIAVTGNTANSNSSAGLDLYNSTNVTVSGNTASNNTNFGANFTFTNDSILDANRLVDNGGATTNNAVYISSADNNKISNNKITDASCTTNCYAINIADAASDNTYISDNTLSTGTINNLGTGTIQAGQVNSSGNYLLQPAGTIELMKDTNVTGTANASIGLNAYSFSSTYALTVQSNIGRGTNSNVVVRGSDSGGNRAAFYVSGAVAGNSFEAGSTSTWSSKITTSASNTGLVIQGAASQASNLLELQNNSGGVLSRFNANGDLQVGGTSSANSTGAFTVQNAAGTSILNVDSTTANVAVRAGADATVLTQIYSGNFTTNWTTTGWTVSGGTTATHNTGNTSPLVYTGFAPTSGHKYIVRFSLDSPCGTVNDTLTVTFGGQTLDTIDGTECTYAYYEYTVTASSAANLTFTPTTNYSGPVYSFDISIKDYTSVVAIAPILTVNNTSNTANIEVRASSDASSMFIGLNSGKVNNTGYYNVGLGSGTLAANLTGYSNTATGHNALTANTVGASNSAYGDVALQANTMGSNNSAFGGSALQSNTIGNGNTAIGEYAGTQNTTGNKNTYIGVSSGSTDSGGAFYTGATLQNATAIGSYAQVQANNSMILGSVDLGIKVGIGTTIPDSLFSVSPMVYNTGTAGTAGVSSTSVTGVGTSWSASGLVKFGMKIIFADGQSSAINSVNSDTSLTLATAVNEPAGTKYRIHVTGFQVTSSGDTYVQKTSTAAFQVKDAGATNLLNIDSSGLKVTVGSTTTDANAVLLSLDSYNNATDPTGVTGAMYYNSATGNFRCYEAGAWQNCMGGGLYSTTSDSTTVTGNTAGAQTLSTSYTMPANYCTAGRVIHLSAGGVTTSTTTAQPISFAVAVGGTVIGTAATTYTPTNSQTNDAWWIDYTFTCRAAPSASSAVYGQGIVTTQLTPTSTGVVTPIVPGNFAGVNVATNASAVISLSVTYTGTASASNTLTLKQLLINGY